ncbi:MAG: hypothetical protein O7G32_14310 [SAR324 cluster bacterium]|nr:hypothetical protein [SAR324 cluster bacterium]
MNLVKNGMARLKPYEDTLKRLVSGDFAELSPAERGEKAEQMIQACAAAAMAMGAAPVPLLELPVFAAMVRALGKVYGAEAVGKKVLLEIAAAAGGGLLLRQAMRFVPFVGGMANASRIYGTTWALGRAAQFYFSRRQAPSREELRQVFQETVENKSREQDERMAGQGLDEKLRTLDKLRKQRLISEEEYQQKRHALLGAL